MTAAISTPSSESIPENFYREYFPFLQESIRSVKELLEFIRNEQTALYGKDPIDHISCRIKSPESMTEKLTRKNYPVTVENALSKVNDACGVRVICRFMNDVFILVKELARCPEIQILEKKDYITCPKKNGYRSFHLILLVTTHCGPGVKQIPVEVQIRSIVMDCWASLEHQMKYKQDIPEQEMYAAELKHCADQMASMDYNLETIRDLINQESDERKSEIK